MMKKTFPVAACVVTAGASATLRKPIDAQQRL